MATPRGGSRFFYAMGQSAASRGESCAGVTLLATAALHARAAFLRGFHEQRGHNRPRSQCTIRVKPATPEQRGVRMSPTIEVTIPLPAPDPVAVKNAEHAITLALLHRLRGEGVSVRACAKQLNIAESTIRGWLKKEGA